MIKNNIIAFVFHIVLCILLTISGMWFFNNSSESNSIFATILLIILAPLVYLFLGYFFTKYNIFKTQNIKLKNLISVSSISVIGVMIWIFCYATVGFVQGDSGMEWILNIIYATPFITTMSILSDINIINVFLEMFLLAFLPSILLWIGIELSVYRKGKKAIN